MGHVSERWNRQRGAPKAYLAALGIPIWTVRQVL